MEEDQVRYDVWTVRNPFSEDFIVSWDRVPYKIPANSFKQLPSFIARHMAKKIVDRQIQEQDPKGIENIHNQTIRDRYLSEVLITGEEEVSAPVTAHVEAKKEVVQVTSNEPEEIDGFEELTNVTSIPSDEELRQEALADSNPKAARAEALSRLSYRDIQSIAKGYDIVANQKSDALIEEIVKKEFN